jgi:hypothetical protein
MSDGRKLRLAQLRIYAKVMVPVPRMFLPGETSGDAQVRELLASLDEDERRQWSDYVNDGKGTCRWPASDEVEKMIIENKEKGA